MRANCFYIFLILSVLYRTPPASADCHDLIHPQYKPQFHRFLTAIGRELRQAWQEERFLAEQHGLEDSSYQRELIREHFFRTQNAELFHLAASYSHAFFQYSVEAWIVNSQNWEEIKHEIFHSALVNRFDGVQLQLAISPDVTQENLSEIESFLDWIRQDFSSTVTLLLINQTS